MKATRVVLALGLSIALSAALPAQAPTVAPRIWDDAALVDWATPVATLNVRPSHYSSAEYYSVPGENLRTYPVYPPDREPPGYWEELQKKKPEPLVDLSKIRRTEDWVAAGERAFREIDNFWSRTDDPVLIAQARDPKTFDGVFTLPDGTAFGPRWVVTAGGMKLSSPACSACHFTVRTDGTVAFAGPRGPRPPGSPPLIPRGLGVIAANAPLAMQRFFEGDPVPMAAWRLWTVPWALDERIESLRSASAGGLQGLAAGDPGVVNRPHGSAYYATKIPDLQILRYSRYLDATGTHRLRGPEDVARYADGLLQDSLAARRLVSAALASRCLGDESRRDVRFGADLTRVRAERLESARRDEARRARTYLWSVVEYRGSKRAIRIPAKPLISRARKRRGGSP